MAERTCVIDGCEGKHFARGWCSRHYYRWRYYGSPTAARPQSQRVPVADRFWPKVKIPENPLDCWEWVGAIDKSSGYGRIQVNGSSGHAHRVSYELSMGTIGHGLEIDHLCRNRACVNPLHLEAVPASVNVRRRPVSSVTHCPQGHPYSGDNLYEYNGHRSCRICRKAAQEAHRLRVLAVDPDRVYLDPR